MGGVITKIEYAGTAASMSGDITGTLVLKDAPILEDVTPIKSWHPGGEPGPLPRRCLRAEMVKGECRFRLCETEGELGAYLILSHRWNNGTERCQTTKDNYDRRVGKGKGKDRADGGEGDSHGSSNVFPIVSQDLTTLFAEAGQIAVRMGIPYIWIDSLCIVQDDVNDWDRESVKMARYYQNAWATLSATTTNDETKGLLHFMSDNAVPTVCCLPYRSKIGERQGYFYVQSDDLSALSVAFERNVENSELMRRG
jgi:hypothetical protein